MRWDLVERSSEDFEGLSGAIKCRGFLDHVNDYKLLNKNCAESNSLNINIHRNVHAQN
jgi:hypothetical protein